MHNMRIVTTDDASNTSLGSIFAWKELLRSTPKTTWIMLTKPGATAAEGWDIQLSEAWTNIRMEDEFRRTPVLTVQPPRARRDPKTLTNNTGTGAMGMVREWMNVAHASGQKTLNTGGSASIFPVIGEFRGRIPTVEYRTFPRVPNSPYPSLVLPRR